MLNLRAWGNVSVCSRESAFPELIEFGVALVDLDEEFLQEAENIRGVFFVDVGDEVSVGHFVADESDFVCCFL